ANTNCRFCSNWLAREAEKRRCHRRLTETPDRISERPPTGDALRIRIVVSSFGGKADMPVCAAHICF
ncbi:MAG: hypothetical protein WCB23_20030, partial [Pseudolabrys sp.]